ncbi:MAG: glycosyltransferase family 39 protein [Candidatus Omnitrophica bacterium]|nr:glycosyltransferase family 39 protein [Candidatus Omnitrophota bacterium]
MKKITIIFLILILCAGCLLRVLAFRGVVGSDDLTYARLAYSIANGTFQTGADSDISGMRVGLLFPVALGIKIAGLTEWVLSAYPFLLSLASILLAFIAGRLFFFSDRAGLIAAALMAIAPMDVSMATMLQSDTPSAFLLNIGILLIYVGAQRELFRSKIMCAVLGGTALGLSWLTRESAVFIFPFIGCYILWVSVRDRRNLTLLVGTALAVMVIVAAESVTYWHFTGDSLYRFHAISKAALKAWTFDTKVFHNNMDTSVWRRILLTGPRKIFTSPISIFALMAIAYTLWTKRKGSGFVALWFLSLVALYNFGSTSLNHYLPLLLAERYLYPLLFPTVILASGLLAVLFKGDGPDKRELNRERIFWGASSAALLFIGCLAICYYTVQGGMNSQTERVVSHILTPADPLYTDSRTPWVLEFFWHYNKAAHAHDFTGMRAEDIPTGSFVLINKERVEFLKSLYSYEPPQFYTSHPKSWINKWHSEHADLYQIE